MSALFHRATIITTNMAYAQSDSPGQHQGCSLMYTIVLLQFWISFAC